MKKKFYAIKVGKGAPCIVDSWLKCQEKTRGFPGARFKSFTSKQAALSFLKDSEFNDKVHPNVIYVDGSYNERTNTYGGAFIHLEDDVIINIWHSESLSNSCVTFRNVAGEILATFEALKYCIANNIKQVTIYFDYEGIRSWADGSWERDNLLTKAYYDFICEIKNSIEISFVKVKGHSGNEYNDIVDELAKRASGVLG